MTEKHPFQSKEEFLHNTWETLNKHLVTEKIPKRNKGANEEKSNNQEKRSKASKRDN